MNLLYQRPQPEAGPSTRPLASFGYHDPSRVCSMGNICPYVTSDQLHSLPAKQPQRRQDVPSALSFSDTTAYEVSTTFDASTTSAVSSTFTDTPLSSSVANASTYTDSYNSTFYPTESSFSSTLATSRTYSSTFSRPWQPPTKATSSHAPNKTPYVPGVILPLTLGGDSDDEAVYSVSMDFGHSAQGGQRKRGPSGSWNGGDPQLVNLQVDLGSSDMWVASTNCSTADCKSAPALFNASQSLLSGFETEFQYHSGQVSGDVYWEQVKIGDFGIGYQAFLAADSVSNEDLGGANFTGVLGLALPANSIILSQIAGSTSGDPDGATFLDNLFGLGEAAPTQRLFALSLERREDVRTSSTLGIGAVSEAFCPPESCAPNYLPIISQASLGTTGYLHWRLPLSGITATTWDSDKDGTGPSARNITLGASRVDTSRATPLAILDSGGVAILVGSTTLADAVYAAYGITASPDGMYRMPCTQQIALSFQFGTQSFAVHPLDLSWPDPSDPSQATCVGAIQYSGSLGSAGDLVLGSSFLKNVYSIFQYPDNLGRGTWQPTVGMISLTNATVASQDFYAVRVERQSLSSVSSDHSDGVGAANPSATNTGSHSNASGPEGRKVLSSAMIAGISVLALFVFAVALFCAWWFWLRRRFGKDGRVEYPDLTAGDSRSTRGHSAALSTSSSRNKKHDAAQRQKSMIEGYSDYDDSWVSTTEGADSIRLGYLPEVLEEHDDLGGHGMPASSSSSARNPSPRRKVEPADPVPRDSPSITHTTLIDDTLDSTRYPSAYAYPTSSWSMSGPFPTSGRQSISRPDASPMYDIRSSDYFDVASGVQGRRAHSRPRGDAGRQPSSDRGRGSSKPDLLRGDPAVEAGEDDK